MTPAGEAAPVPPVALTVAPAGWLVGARAPGPADARLSELALEPTPLPILQPALEPAEASEPTPAPPGLALVGAGRFGALCLEAYAKSGLVSVICVSDENQERARKLAEPRGLSTAKFADLLNDERVSIVHLCTPPSLHAKSAIAALRAGKHVFLEGPVATNLEDAEALAAVAAETGRQVIVNHLPHQHPLWRAALAVSEAGLFGPLQRLEQTTLASSEGLDDAHWIWHREVSGGLFVGRATPFLDLARRLVGQPETRVSAQAVRHGVREDRVSCTFTYAGGATGNLYYAVERTDRSERGTARLYFARGQISLHGLALERLEVEGLLKPEAVSTLETLLGVTARVTDEPNANGRNDVLVSAVVTRPEPQEDERAAIRANLSDLTRAIHDPAILRLGGLNDDLNGLRAACAARQAADENNTLNLEEEA